MNNTPLPYDENNPGEVVRFYWEQFITIIRQVWTWSNLGILGISTLVVVAIVILAMGIDTALPFLADFVPMLVAIVGIIMSYRQPRQENHALATFVLILTGLVGTGILSWARIRNDAAHKAEMGDLTKKVLFVGDQNTQILNKLVTAPPEQDAKTKEISRRESVLVSLRNEYILSHKDVSADMLAGTEWPAAEWVNIRLRQLGESWSVPENTSKANLRTRTLNFAQSVLALVDRYSCDKLLSETDSSRYDACIRAMQDDYAGNYSGKGLSIFDEFKSRGINSDRVRGASKGFPSLGEVYLGLMHLADQLPKEN